ncbi:MAG: restriction endonuclease subunit S, partial [bacterium]
MSWSAETLGDVVDRDGGMIRTGPFGSQLHQSDYASEGIPVIMPKDISDGRVDPESVARVSEETAIRMKRHQLSAKTIVLPRRGEITKRAFIREEQAGWLCGTGCLQIVLEGNRLLPEFLYYYMEQQEVSRWLEQHAVGTTMLNLSATIVTELPVKYPAPVAQVRIVDILSSYDALIENNRRRMVLLEEAARQL